MNKDLTQIIQLNNKLFLTASSPNKEELNALTDFLGRFKKNYSFSGKGYFNANFVGGEKSNSPIILITPTLDNSKLDFKQKKSNKSFQNTWVGVTHDSTRVLIESYIEPQTKTLKTQTYTILE